MKIKRIIEVEGSDYNAAVELSKELDSSWTLSDRLRTAIVQSKPYDNSEKEELISREDLKKILSDPLYRSTIKDYGEILKYTFVMDIINSAPTVEQEVYMTGKDFNLYMEGYKQGKKDFERPQGEWTEFEGGYRCSNCDDIEVYTPNFCPICGADMRGGEK